MSEKKRLSIFIWGPLLGMALVLGLVILVAVVGWWSGWTRLIDFRKAIQLAGLIVLGLGALGIIGRDWLSDENTLAAEESAEGRDKPGLVGSVRRFSFSLVMFFAGVVCLVIGWML